MSKRGRKRFIHLEEGEQICPKCNGSSASILKRNYCKFCLNSGKVDWIENITGKTNIIPITIEKTKLNPISRKLKTTWKIVEEQDYMFFSERVTTLTKFRYQQSKKKQRGKKWKDQTL